MILAIKRPPRSEEEALEYAKLVLREHGIIADRIGGYWITWDKEEWYPVEARFDPEGP